MTVQDLDYFCQFGGHNSTIERVMKFSSLLSSVFPEVGNICSLWLVCQGCATILLTLGDATMFVLRIWGRQFNTINKVPISLSIDPLRQAQLVNYIDFLLNNKFRKKLGNRFPAFLTTPNETEKKYFLDKLEQDIMIRFFLPEIENAAERVSIGLRLWAGAIVAAKATRSTYNVSGGQQNYTLEQRQVDFKEADNYAKDDSICMLGVQIAPMLELLIRSHPKISLEGAEANSEIRKYLKAKGKNDITKEDIEINTI